MCMIILVNCSFSNILFIYRIKGNEYWLSKKIDLEVIISAARERGRKPDELYGIAERLAGYDCRKLELFGSIQNLRPGWLSKLV